MANTYTSLGGLFTAIANAIRAKKGTTDTIVADNFPSEIESIASQPSLQSKTVSPSTAAQTITPDSGYDGLSQVVVNAISPTKGAQTYTPTTTDQTISSGRWLTGAQTIKGDANLVASNIKSGVNIFGVSGSYAGQYKFSYFSGITPYSSKEFRIPVDSNIAQVVGVVVNASSQSGMQTNNLYSFIWWKNQTDNGNNFCIMDDGGYTVFGFNVIQTPIPIGGTSSGKYARLISETSITGTTKDRWVNGKPYEGFIVCKVSDS